MRGGVETTRRRESRSRRASVCVFVGLCVLSVLSVVGAPMVQPQLRRAIPRRRARPCRNRPSVVICRSGRDRVARRRTMAIVVHCTFIHLVVEYSVGVHTVRRSPVVLENDLRQCHQQRHNAVQKKLFRIMMQNRAPPPRSSLRNSSNNGNKGTITSQEQTHTSITSPTSARITGPTIPRWRSSLPRTTLSENDSSVYSTYCTLK